ncbi:MAG: UDP-N-acetylmuramoyl-tripeptide--D-alanyl-D-alanine ligase [Synergistes sp.]|nr:UDP-N-acetylmuramoyl-tripeptide--D-alanyl-D-alanine ligase [Synergistes sp.]
MPFFAASEGARICGGRLAGPDREISAQWSCDSREVTCCGAFAALKGASTDGHLYIAGAAKAGAKMMLVSEDELEKQELAGKYSDISFIAVKDTEAALCMLAREYLRRTAPKTLAITGSVGKTTTRELTASALRERFRVHSAVRSFNTLIGCSLTILSMPADTEVLVLELGTNHFGEIAEMVESFPPEIAVITEVAPCHLEGFGTVEGVLRAKTEICRSRSLKTVIYNCDNELLKNYFASYKGDITAVPVGHSGGSGVRIGNCVVELGENGPRTEAEVTAEGGRYVLSSPLFGMQHSYNMAYAFAAAVKLGLSPHEAAAGIAGTKALSGRGVCRRIAKRGWLIDEAYNANPLSMHAAIENTRAAAERLGLRRCAVLGGMRELGESSDHWHRRILAELGDFDEVMLLGSEWNACGDLPANTRLFSSREDLISAAAAVERDDSVILVKGSNSYGLKHIAGAFPEI